MNTRQAIDATTMMHELIDAGFGPFIAVPCSFLAPLVTWCEREAPDLYVAANNEGEAVAMATGGYLAGKRAVVMIQNSGLGNTVNPLTSLCHPMRIPLLMIVTWRGEPGRPDEPQHQLMGAVTLPLLELMGIRHEMLATTPSAFRAQVHGLASDLRTAGPARALVVPGGAIEPVPATPPATRAPMRRDVIAAIADVVSDDTVVVATTGKTSRELEAKHDRPTNLYVVGSMGCASSTALGVAMAQPDRPVVVIDGDGAALMRLEAMVSIGVHRLPRFVHVLLDNGAYESTGGQRTNSPAVDFLGVARACGYTDARSTADADVAADEVRRALHQPGPRLIRVEIGLGSAPGLGRPSHTPAQVAARLRESIGARP